MTVALRRRRAACTFVVLVVLGVIGPAGPAAADPPGPTDYESRVDGIVPATDAIAVRFIGGDSFIELAVTPGHEVLVIGYRGEPYLHFAADGTVTENRRAPTRYLNEDRLGETEVPASADPDAEPEWAVVANDGEYAWHDHRTHWMNTAAPPSSTYGDRILEAVVPVVVDGIDTDIAVSSYWLEGPGLQEQFVLAILAVAVFVVVLVLPRRVRWWAAGLVTIAALVLGVVAFRSVPSETGPPASLWLLPAVALPAVIVGYVTWRRAAPTWRPLADAFLFLAGGELALWGFSRRFALDAAIIPTDTPATVDRAGIVTVGAAGAALAVAALALLLGRRDVTASG